MHRDAMHVRDVFLISINSQRSNGFNEEVNINSSDIKSWVEKFTYVAHLLRDLKTDTIKLFIFSFISI